MQFHDWFIRLFEEMDEDTKAYEQAEKKRRTGPSGAKDEYEEEPDMGADSQI